MEHDIMWSGIISLWSLGVSCVSSQLLVHLAQLRSPHLP